MDAYDWCFASAAIIAAVIIGSVANWLLSSLLYDYLRHDVYGWCEAFREWHERQLAYYREERKIEHDYMLMLLDKLIERIREMRDKNNGKPPEGKS